MIGSGTVSSPPHKPTWTSLPPLRRAAKANAAVQSAQAGLATARVNAGPQVARFALTVFEPGVGPGSRSEATDV